MSLIIQELAVGWEKRNILESLSLSLKPGEFTGLLGPNGSGKSTLLKTVLGFLKPSRGRVLFTCGAMGEPAELSHKEAARRLAFVPQSPGNTVSITVRDMILMGRLPHLQDRWSGYTPADKERVDKVMEKLGLTALADRDAAYLSGGEMQKVSIARCLVQEGDILLLDEATSGLDMNHTIEIMELLREKADKENTVILAVLHDLNTAFQYCDSIAFLKKGRILCRGKPQDIVNETLLETVYGVRVIIENDEAGRPVIIPRRRDSTHKEDSKHVYRTVQVAP